MASEKIEETRDIAIENREDKGIDGVGSRC